MTATKKSLKFILLDILYLAMIILPFAGAIVLKVLITPQTEGVSLTGAIILWQIPMPLQDLYITEVQINSWAVVIAILGLVLFLRHGLSVKPYLKRQLVLEWIVEQCDNLVMSNMGQAFMGFSPFICAIMALSAFSSLSSLLGIFPPTSDLNIIAGWAILVFILITYFKLKGGFFHNLKSYTEPIAVMTPMNIISEFATPVSMTMRHFGNVLSGVVISSLLGVFLSSLTAGLPGLLGQIPFLRVGIPAVLSLYFDIFSGCLQAFIFAMLTMQYVANGFPGEAYEKRLKRRAERAARRAAEKA